MIWRLVVEGVATLRELETEWSLDDLERAAAVLSYREDLQAHDRS